MLLLPMSAGERAQRQHARQLVLEKLWKCAVSKIKIRHPDPQQSVECSFEHLAGDVARGSFKLDVRDTRDPDKIFKNGFTMPWLFRGWPGEEIAELFLAAVFALYMQHEALELVFKKEMLPQDTAGLNPYPDYARVFDPHGDEHTDYHWNLMRNAMYGEDDDSEEIIIGTIVGRERAREIMLRNRARGRQDIERGIEEVMTSIVALDAEVPE